MALFRSKSSLFYTTMQYKRKFMVLNNREKSDNKNIYTRMCVCASNIYLSGTVHEMKQTQTCVEPAKHALVFRRLPQMCQQQQSFKPSLDYSTKVDTCHENLRVNCAQYGGLTRMIRACNAAIPAASTVQQTKMLSSQFLSYLPVMVSCIWGSLFADLL